jgi:putative ABC transport system permease protein
MEQKSVAFLFFIESITMGITAIFIGILLGTFFSQLLTLKVMNFFKEEYHIYFSLYPDTVLITFIVFVITFIMIGILNIRTIRKSKIIDMLQADKILQSDMKKEFLMPFIVLVITAVSVYVIHTGQYLIESIDNNVNSLFDTISVYANMFLPVAFILSVVSYLILCIIKRKILSFSRLVLLLTGITILEIVFSLQVVAGHPVMNHTISNRYFLFACVFLVFLIFSLFYSLSTLIQLFKERSKSLKYKGNTLFLAGQINGRLSSTSRTMSIISGCILLAIVAFIVDPVLSGWAMGYLDKRAVYDIQINSQYTSRTTYDTLPDGDFSYVEDALNANDVTLSDSVTVEIYFIEESDFTNASTASRHPMMAMGLSDYNHMRTMAGYQKITLAENEFTTQWHFSATNEDMDAYLKKHTTLSIHGSTLKQASNMNNRAELGEVIYSFETYGIVIVPDSVTKGLLMGQCNYYGKTAKKLSYVNASKLYDTIYDGMELRNTGANSFALRMRTLQRNNGISMSLLMKLLLFYGGIVLLIISFTVLSLQQLADSFDFKKRFIIIKKMGVSDASINKIIWSQISIWFALPLILAGISAWIAGKYFINLYKVNIELYIGMNELYQTLNQMIFTIIVLFLCYFISTWVLFKKNIQLV